MEFGIRNSKFEIKSRLSYDRTCRLNGVNERIYVINSKFGIRNLKLIVGCPMIGHASLTALMKGYYVMDKLRIFANLKIT